jgi:hypothetical protein
LFLFGNVTILDRNRGIMGCFECPKKVDGRWDFRCRDPSGR